MKKQTSYMYLLPRHVKFLKKNAGQRAERRVFHLKFCARSIRQNMYKARLESFQDNVKDS